MAKPRQRGGATRRPAAPARRVQSAKPGPAQAPAPAPAVAEEPPATVRLAVRLMYAGAALSAVVLIVSLATAGQARSVLHASQPHLSSSALTTRVHQELAYAVVLWLITIAFWLIMARSNLAGRNWARIFATVLCALSTVNFAVTVSEPSSLVSKLIYAPLWPVGVAAVVLLWRPPTTAWIQSAQPAAPAAGGPRRPAPLNRS